MYFLGIDIGGTMTKAGLYLQDGKEIMVSEKSNNALTPHPGWVERDLDEFWVKITHGEAEVHNASRNGGDTNG